MEITVQELAALDPKGYVLLDMRGSEAREYGSIPGSVGVSPEELSRYNGDRGKKVIIYCARGQVSLDAAIALRERSYDAYSLSGRLSRLAAGRDGKAGGGSAVPSGRGKHSQALPTAKSGAASPGPYGSMSL